MISDINTHICTEDITVSGFLKQFELSHGDKAFTPSDFLNFNLTRGLSFNGVKINPTTNLDRIKSAYGDQEELNTNVLSKTPSEVIIRQGTEVGIPNFAIKRDLTRTKQPEVIQLTKYPSFICSVFKNLLQDPNYVRSMVSNSGYQQGRVEDNNISVYIWIRSLGRPNQQGQWYDISPFVLSARTTVNDQLGVFTLSLSPIKATYTPNVGWGFDDVKSYDGSSVRNNVLSQIATSKYTGDQDRFLNRENNFFNTVLQENDLVYIRFDRLSNEREQQLVNRAFDEGDIPGSIYDMIGLIDIVSNSTAPNDIAVNVQGRDLMKVLIEDGSYFFPEQFAQNLFRGREVSTQRRSNNGLSFQATVGTTSLLERRNLIEAVGSSLMSYSYSFKTIEVVLKFILNKFSNIGYVPTESLRGYGDELVKHKFELKASQLKNNFSQILEEIDRVFLKQERQGVWTIIDLVFDITAASRVMADNTIAQDNGSIINSIQKLCQQPFVEFKGDTYGDRYVLTIRKPPVDEQGYKALVYGNATYDKVNDGVNYSGRDYQAKLKRDKRKQLQTGRPSSISDLVIDIDETEVIGDNLTYHTEAYSWYRLIPKGLGNIGNLASFQLAPIVSFDEYAEVWGNKMYSIESNYSPVDFLQDNGLKAKVDYAEAQAFYDLQFLIQSNAYLPFTRTGTITIVCNRLIKRGYFIYYKPTREIFLVKGVTHIVTRDGIRQTTLSVERGMKEPFIKGQFVKFRDKVEKVSYFNIINTDVDNTASINNKTFLKNWVVNKNVFDFFIQRRQWNDDFAL